MAVALVRLPAALASVRARALCAGAVVPLGSAARAASARRGRGAAYFSSLTAAPLPPAAALRDSARALPAAACPLPHNMRCARGSAARAEPSAPSTPHALPALLRPALLRAPAGPALALQPPRRPAFHADAPAVSAGAPAAPAGASRASSSSGARAGPRADARSRLWSASAFGGAAAAAVLFAAGFALASEKDGAPEEAAGADNPAGGESGPGAVAASPSSLEDLDEIPLYNDPEVVARLSWPDKLKYYYRCFVYYFNNPGHAQGPVLLPKSPTPHFTVVLDPRDLLLVETLPDGKKRAKKRPGIDFLLSRLYGRCEIILWCAEQNMYESDNAQKLHKAVGEVFTHILWYSETTLLNDKVCKDLRRLNRDLSLVFLITSEEDNASLQPENALFLPKWDGSSEDTALLDLGVFLEATMSKGLTQDIRLLLKAYKDRNMDILESWRPVRIRQIEEAKRVLQMGEEKKKRKSIWNALR